MSTPSMRSALEAFKQAPQQLVVHYSCSQWEKAIGSTRIIAIVALDLATDQKHVFALHLEAERAGINPSDIEAHADDLEKTILKKFFAFAAKHRAAHWLHWCMHDIRFGFDAFEHRSKIHGGRTHHISEERRLNLAHALVDHFGDGAIPHPRFYTLIEANGLQNDELTKRESWTHATLLTATIRKVYCIARLYERFVKGDLILPNNDHPRGGAAKQLSKTEQKIIDLVAQKPLAGRSIAGKVELDYDYCRKLLGKLVKRGILMNDSSGYTKSQM